MRKINRNGLWLLCLFLPLAQADVYRWTDANGRTHYADRAQPENAQPLNIETATTLYAVKRVYDGDTIELSNGDKVRFLGINTPEIAHRGQPAEAGGDTAKNWLNHKLQHSRVYLEKDVEHTDKYGRILAHVFTEDKQHLNLELVKAGLATATIHPPNLKYSQTLLAAQQQAEQKRLGLWQLPDYTPIAADALNDSNYHGWKRLTGTVQTLKSGKGGELLQFSDHFSVKIDRISLPLFPPLQSYVKQRLELRGWVNKNGETFTMHLRHPGDIAILRPLSP